MAKALCSNSMPQFPIHEMTMNRSALILNSQDFCFSPAEMDLLIACDDLRSEANANIIVDAYQHFHENRDLSGCLVTLGVLLEMLSFVSALKVSCDEILGQAETLLLSGLTGEQNFKRTNLLLGMGITSILFRGSIRSGQGILRAAYAVAKKLN